MTAFTPSLTLHDEAASLLARLVVHVVEDDEAVRTALVGFARAAGYRAQGHASAGTVLTKVELGEAGCVIAAVARPDLEGLALLDELKSRERGLPIIALTGQGDVPSAVAALKAGASDCIETPFRGESLLEALEQAITQRAVSLRRRAALDGLRARAARLSSREREVMELVAAGCTNADASRRLGISVRTVESHRARVMHKMQARGPVELTRMALRLKAG